MKKTVALLLVLPLLLTGCGGKKGFYEAEPEQNVVQSEQTEPTEELGCAGTDAMPWYNAEVTDLGLCLLRGSINEEKNVLISPVSVMAALSMTINGAEGDTLTQMETALGRDKDALNQWYERDIVKAGNASVHLANGLFLKDDPELTVKEAFIQTVEKWYEKTDILITSFNEYSVDHINQYVQDNTDGMIQNILNEMPQEAIMYLVNALAFEAQWANPYNEYQVSEQIFTTEDGREQTVELMYAEETYAYVENELVTGFLKDYTGGRYAFAALLPKEGLSVEELADSLSGDAVADLFSYRWEGKVLTALPKFQTEFDVEMHEVLRGIGMTDAFDPCKADFSGLATYAGGNIFINRVLHKSFISVGEQGTRAGAATVMEMAAGEAMAPEEIKEVILNRPFLYMIWDTQTNMPIFMGTFVDAQAQGTSVPPDDPEIVLFPAEKRIEGDYCIVDE